MLAAVVAVALWARRAGANDERSDGDSCALFDQDHTAWTKLLTRYVRAGIVDYAGLRRGGEAELNDYLRSLQSVCRGHFDTWSRAQKLAFWVNAYNAYTVRLILNHYPLKSIRAIGLLPGAAFRADFIPMEKLRGDTISLNVIENEILRKELREPRIHFAIVCASTSCPMLRTEAYRAAELDRQLDDGARGFLRDSTKNRFDAVTNTLRLSSIFDWFHEDFEGAAGSLQAFVARYADAPTARAIGAGGVRVEHLDYDWSLNGR
ncbi:MAG: DUF547 domain-containing protein [Deltaproteobacteria bacterium]|nr:DUF547 domain-containing protein [Deltaproteobacteria bacterium]